MATMLACDRIETNPYRILELSGSASAPQIFAAAAHVRRAILLGGSTAELPPLRSQTQTEATVLAAVGRLMNPLHRLEDRLFWFQGPVQPEHGTENGSNPAARSAVTHDEALRGLITGYASPNAEGMTAAITQWHVFVANSQYWEDVPDLEKEGRFEPAAITPEVLALRDKAVALAAAPFERAAREAWARKDVPVIRACLLAFQNLQATGAWASKAREDLVTAMMAELTEACRILREQYRGQVAHNDDADEKNLHICEGALGYYRGFIEPISTCIAAVLRDDDLERLAARADAAETLALIALDYTWADRRPLAEELAEEAIALAAGTIVVIRLRALLQNLLDRATDGLRTALEAFHRDFTQPAETQQTTAATTVICEQALKGYRNSVGRALNQLLIERTGNREGWLTWREKAAKCLAAIATRFEQASQFSIAEDLTLEALELAKGTATAASLEELLARRGELATEQRKGQQVSNRMHSAIELVRQRCRALSTVRNRITARDGFAEPNRAVCHDELVYFRAQIEPALHEATLLWPSNDPVLLTLRGEVAVCVANIAADHTWATDWPGAQRFMQEAFRLCQGTPAAEDVLQKFLQMQRTATDQSKQIPAASTWQNRLRFKGWAWFDLATAAALIALMVSGVALSNAAPPQAPEPSHAPSHPEPTMVSKITLPPAPAVAAPTHSTAQPKPAQLDRQIRILTQETAWLKAQRASGAPIDSLLYNEKLAERERLVQQLHVDAHAPADP